VVVDEIEREFKRALKAQNLGIPPVPLKLPFRAQYFSPSLISANGDVAELHEAMTNLPHRSAGRDVSIIGPLGTGRRGIAQHLATATGFEPRMVPLSLEALKMDPYNAHALDIEQSELDRRPIVFEGNATPFLVNSKGHPLLDRVRAHPLPTFFIGELHPDHSTEELSQRLSHLTQVLRTGFLSREQLQTAFKEILNIDATPDDLNNLNGVNIESVVAVKSQLEMIGKEGDKEAAIKRLAAMKDRLQDHEPKNFGLAAGIEARRAKTAVVSQRS
jgi:hypothetical protein